jgi:hypothetical protein
LFSELYCIHCIQTGIAYIHRITLPSRIWLFCVSQKILFRPLPDVAGAVMVRAGQLVTGPALTALKGGSIGFNLTCDLAYKGSGDKLSLV